MHLKAIAIGFAALVLAVTAAGPALADHEDNVVEDCADLLANVNKQRSFAPGCVPPNLIQLGNVVVVDAKEPQFMRQEAAVALGDLIEAAFGQGHALYVFSAYRSYDEQAQVFQALVDDIGLEEADRRSARPGHSEHQLGTTVDISTLEIGIDQALAETPAGQWLAVNAGAFGFVISYPEGQEEVTGYVHEPWHIRWVGENVARDLAASGLTLTQWLAADYGLFEGWNRVVWEGFGVSGVEEVVDAIGASVEGTTWISVAAFDGEWLQTFADAPLPEFNTLTALAQLQDIWVYVEGEGAFDS